MTTRQRNASQAIKRQLSARMAMLERDRRAGQDGIALDFDSKALVWQRCLTEYTALVYLFSDPQPAN